MVSVPALVAGEPGAIAPLVSVTVPGAAPLPESVPPLIVTVPLPVALVALLANSVPLLIVVPPE